MGEAMAVAPVSVSESLVSKDGLLILPPFFDDVSFSFCTLELDNSATAPSAT
jgi:hypothetical protein